MKDLTINGHTLKLYSSSEELPVNLYSKFNNYMMVDLGVGSNMDSIGKHLSKLFEFATHKLNDAILAELKNLYYNYYLILEGVNISALAFLCLVHSIDDEEISDYSEDHLKVLIQKLDDIKMPVSEIKEQVYSTKKK